MLNSRPVNKECSTINQLIKEIDCKLAKLGSRMYYNITMLFDTPIQERHISSLLHYRRILQYKYVNAEYAEEYSVDDIASRIGQLKNV